MIHKTAILGKNVTLEKGVEVGAYAIIQGFTHIGKNTKISPFAVIGTNAEHKEFFDQEGCVDIGENCTIREYVTVNAGTEGKTIVGNNCILLRGSHVGHDSVLDHNVTLSCNALIGGHSYIMHHCNLGLGAVTHQFSLLGAGAMIGMNGTVTKKSLIKPYQIYIGSPVKRLRENKHLTKDLTYKQIEADQAYFELIRRGRDGN